MKAQTGLFKVLLAGGALALAQAASAGNISFNPTPALIGAVGGTVDVDLVWTGGAGEYIGAFDIDIGFDSTIAAPTFYVFDPATGFDSLGAQDCTLGDIGLNLYNVCGVSLDIAGDLVSNQNALGGTFPLVRLTFTGVAEGVTDLFFVRTLFGDELGLPMDVTLVNGKICVGADGCPQVPEPGTLALLGLGLAGLGLARRRNAS